MTIPRIAFILGDLCPYGGVADYTNLLSRALVERGCRCLLVAINDHGRNEDRPKKGDVMRIPQSLDWPSRVQEATTALKAFQPDWVSWQMVPYSYNPKGILLREGAMLARLLRPHRVQIMVHELWVGDYPDLSVRGRLIRPMQKFGLLRTVGAVQPTLVHTSIMLYRSRLRAAGIRANMLPLFGNVPVGAKSADNWLWPILRAAEIAFDPAHRSDWWMFGVFGAIHSNWPAEPLLHSPCESARRVGKRAALLSFGRAGDRTRLTHWRRAIPTLAVVELGEMPATKISELLNTIDFGLAATPQCALGKSGAVAAMIEHGVPVIANHGYARPGIDPSEDIPLTFRADSDLESLLTHPPLRTPIGARVNSVRDQLLAEMEEAERPVTHQ